MELAATTPAPDQNQALIEVMARALHADFNARGYGDYQYDWDDPLASRDYFRTQAQAALQALHSEGYAVVKAEPDEQPALALSFQELEDLHSAVAGVVTAQERWVPDEEARWERCQAWLTRLAIAGNERFPANWKGLPLQASNPQSKEAR
jgi:hypothetical protein